MARIIPPKPFPDYKWRWASYQPTEGLLRTDIYLGVLRVFHAHEGQRPSSPDVSDALRVVQKQTQSNIDLVRDPVRNLIRNSGQYWKGTGLLENTSGKIELTQFGRQVAEGRVTSSEFALAVVKTLTLPNPRIDSDKTIAQWKAAGLEIRPLQLLLSIMAHLEDVAGDSQAYITPNELIRVVIPLAGTKASLDKHAAALVAHRAGSLSLSGWPDCAPESNDKRMAREFLLFLGHYGLCRCDHNSKASAYDYKFSLASLAASDVAQLQQIAVPATDVSLTLKDIRLSELPAVVDEERRTSQARASRPKQAAFRRDVFEAYDSTCLISGEKITEALIAAHIIDKKFNGADTANNGICLRADIHNLFDAGHIRIDPDGNLHYSDAMASSVSYTALPQSIEIPKFVTPLAVEWRWKYRF